MSATIHNEGRDQEYQEIRREKRECPNPPSTRSYTPISPNPVPMPQTYCPTPLTQAGVCSITLGRSLRLSQNSDYAQIVKSRSPVKQSSCEYETSLVRSEPDPTLTYDYPPTQRETIERYIAVPISSTDHLLISSTGTGQHYLAEPVSNLLSERIQERMSVAQGYANYSKDAEYSMDASYSKDAGYVVETSYNKDMVYNLDASYNDRDNSYYGYTPATLESPTYDKPPPPLPAPGYERPVPLGASSRATSKMSLDCLDKETNF